MRTFFYWIAALPVIVSTKMFLTEFPEEILSVSPAPSVGSGSPDELKVYTKEVVPEPTALNIALEFGGNSLG